VAFVLSATTTSYLPLSKQMEQIFVSAINWPQDKTNMSNVDKNKSVRAYRSTLVEIVALLVVVGHGGASPNVVRLGIVLVGLGQTVSMFCKGENRSSMHLF
jgi:hypothetical protein